MNKFFSFSLRHIIIFFAVILLAVYLSCFISGYIVYNHNNNLEKEDSQGMESNLSLIHSDGRSYYFYLPYFFVNKEAALGSVSWARGYTEHYPPPLNKCNIGVAVMIAPFFLLAHILTIIFNYSAYGFSIFYQHSVGVAGITYFLLGFFFLKKILLRYFSEKITLFTLLAIFFGSNLFHYATFDSSFSHIYSFFLFCWMLFIIPRWYKRPDYKNSILLGIVFGLIPLVRLFNILVLLFFILYDLNSINSLKTRLIFIKNNYKKIIIVILFAIIIFVPQLIMWKISTGSWFVHSYSGESTLWLLPNITGVLFSIQKGLFFWFPILIFIIPGFYFLKKDKGRELFLPLLVYISLLIYATSTWWEWWFGAGFGHRIFSESFSFFAILIASFYASLKTKRSKIFFSIISILFISHTSLQMIFYWKGMVAFQGPNLQTYQVIFNLPERIVTELSLFMESILHDFRITNYLLIIPLIILIIAVFIFAINQKRKNRQISILLIAILSINIISVFYVYKFFPTLSITNKNNNSVVQNTDQSDIYRSLIIDFPGMSNYKFWTSKEIRYLPFTEMFTSDIYLGNTYYKQSIGEDNVKNIDHKKLIINNNILSILNIKYIIGTLDSCEIIKELLSIADRTYYKREKVILNMDEVTDAFVENDNIEIENNKIIIKNKESVLKLLSTPIVLKENSDYAISFELSSPDKLDNHIYFDFFGNNYDFQKQEFTIHHEDVTVDYTIINTILTTGSIPEKTDIFFRIFTNSAGTIIIKNLEIFEVSTIKSEVKYSYSLDNPSLLENKKTAPRFYFPSRIIFADNTSDIKDIIWENNVFFYSNKFYPGDEIVIQDLELKNIEIHSNGKIKIRSYKNDRILLETDCQGNAFLVFSEIYYPGWRASINGDRTKVYRTNGLTMGIIIPEGNSLISFEYFPNKVSAYIIIALSISVISFLIISLKRKNKRLVKQ